MIIRIIKNKDYFNPVLYEEVLNENVFTLDFIQVPEERLYKAIKDWTGFGMVEYIDVSE